MLSGIFPCCAESSNIFQEQRDPYHSGTDVHTRSITTADTISTQCSGCTLGMGQIFIGTLISMGAILKESLCWLYSGISITACGMGNFFSALYLLFSAIFCSRD